MLQNVKYRLINEIIDVSVLICLNCKRNYSAEVSSDKTIIPLVCTTTRSEQFSCDSQYVASYTPVYDVHSKFI